MLDTNTHVFVLLNRIQGKFFFLKKNDRGDNPQTQDTKKIYLSNFLHMELNFIKNSQV